jgi:formate dehydrogenase gamma subunit
MKDAKIIRGPKGEILVERFKPIRRFEHWLALVTFVALIVTGMPQKFYDASWASVVLDLLGGLERARMLHRIAGVLFAGHAVIHLLAILVGILRRKLRLTLVPTSKDFLDVWHNLLYYLGRRTTPPEFPKFDYKQKFEYFGIVLGGLVMIATGLMLMYPTLATMVLPGQIIAASRVAHSNEALLALSVLTVWHVYDCILSPEVFPLDRTIFTGYISAHDLKERYRHEYRRIFPEGEPGER